MFMILRVCLTLVESTISSTNRINSTPGGNRSDSVSLFFDIFLLLAVVHLANATEDRNIWRDR